MENIIFNRSKFYSQKNANIIEKLLDRKIVPFIEIMKIFFPHRVINDIDSFLMNLMQPGATRDLINHIQPNFLLRFTQESFYLLFAQRWLIWRKHCVANIGESHPQICANNFLSFLIDVGELPAEIRRLPRLTNKQVTPAYYDDIFDYSTAKAEEIIFHSANYCDSEPVILTYFEAIKLITQKGYPESLLRNGIIEKEACFLRVNSKDTRTEQLKNIFNLDYFREANSGNALYKTRYKGYERLKKETIEELFNGKTISVKTIPIEDVNIKDKYDVEIKAKDNDGNPIFGTYIGKSLEVQTTDIETKLHLKRRILSCIQRMPDGTTKQSYEFRLKDTWYLQEYIEALILWAGQNAQAAKTTDEEIYNTIALSVQEIIDLRKDIPSETTKIRNQRITRLTDKYQNELDTKFNREFPRIHILQRIINLLRPIYQEFNLELPSDDSCTTTDRRIRRENPIGKK